MHPLGVLLRNTREVNGWSQREVGKRATRHGYKLSGSGVSALENEPINSVSAKQVRGLAAALSLPERVVLSHFLASMGYPSESGRGSTVEDAIRADGRLSSDDKELLLAMIRQMRRKGSSVAVTSQETENPEKGLSVEHQSDNELVEPGYNVIEPSPQDTGGTGTQRVTTGTGPRHQTRRRPVTGMPAPGRNTRGESMAEGGEEAGSQEGSGVEPGRSST